jgi:hypothetical protein
MLTRVADLEIGDEIIVPSMNDFKYLKILQMPRLDSRGYYKKVKCSIRNEEKGTKRWADYRCTALNHNDTIYMDLECKQIWMVKKNDKLC